MFSVSSVLKVPDLSDNFLVRNGIFFTKKEYFRNHIKIIDNKNLLWLREYLKEVTGECVDPFMMTNKGDLLVYLGDRNLIAFYYADLKSIDWICNYDEYTLGWLMDNFLTEKSLRPLFNKQFFRFDIEYSEILVLPAYEEDTKYNYKTVNVEVAYELYRQGF